MLQIFICYRSSFVVTNKWKKIFRCGFVVFGWICFQFELRRKEKQQKTLIRKLQRNWSRNGFNYLSSTNTHTLKVTNLRLATYVDQNRIPITESWVKCKSPYWDTILCFSFFLFFICFFFATEWHFYVQETWNFHMWTLSSSMLSVFVFWEKWEF